MKKLICLLVAMVIAIMPLSAKALEDLSYYNTNDLAGTLNAEGLDIQFSNYSENDKQVTVYLFWRYGCHYCEGFLNYLNSIADKQGQYFKLVSFEVSEDSNNSALLDEVGEFLDADTSGVPFAIIGKTVVPGYDEEWNDSILNAIMTEYESTNRYDVFQEMKKAQDEELRKNRLNTLEPVLYNFIIIAIATIVIILYIRKQNNNIQDRLDTIYEKLGISLEEDKKVNSKDDDEDEIEESPKKNINTKKKNTTKKNKSK